MTRDKFEVKTICICPKCCEEHIIQMHWIGNGIPRVYCDTCKISLKNTIEIDIDNTKHIQPYSCSI